MKIKRIALLLAVVSLVAWTASCFFGCGYKLPEYVDVYVTTGTMSKLMARQTSLKFEDETLFSSGISVTVEPDERKQDFYGYGASLTHASAYLLMQDGAEEVANEMLKELFGSDGARLSLVRIPIGASDYIEGDEWFTCCDEYSVTLDSFTIERDANIIAVAKKIKKINPDVKFFACPWSAPAWMKDVNSLLGGTLQEKYYEVYVNYLIKFVEAYKAEGIDISFLSLVNEPYMSNGKYPYMMLDEYQALEIGASLEKKLSKKDLDVKLLGWEHNVDTIAEMYVDKIFENKDTPFAGVAFHGYSDVNEATIADGCEYVKTNYDDRLIFMTEITEHTGSNDFANNLSYAARYVTVDPINYGLNGAMFWNLTLHSDGTPTPVKHGNECYGVMDMDYSDGEFTYSKRSSYYAMAHVGKFAYEIDGKYPKAVEAWSDNDTQILACALYRADGALIVTAVNVSDQLSETVHVIIGEKSVSFELTPQSVVTFVC